MTSWGARNTVLRRNSYAANFDARNLSSFFLTFLVLLRRAIAEELHDEEADAMFKEMRLCVSVPPTLSNSCPRTSS